MNRLKAHDSLPKIAVLCLILSLFLTLHLQSLNDGIKGEPLRVTAGSIQQFRCNDPSVPLTPLATVTLPHWETGTENPLRCLRMTTTLTREQLTAGHGPAKLMLYAKGSLGRVWLNGEKIDEIIHSDYDKRVTWLRPYSLAIPSHLVRPTNVMALEYYTYQSTFHIGELLFGEEPMIESMMRWVTFLSRTTLEGSTVLFGIIGIFLISFSLLFKRERLIGLAGKGMLGLALFQNLLMMIEVPADLYIVSQAIMYGLTAWALFAFSDFFMIIAEAKPDPLPPQIRNIFGVSASVMCLFFGTESIEYLNIYCYGGTILYFTLILIRCTLQANALQKNEGRLLILQGLISLVLLTHDYLVITGQMKYLWQLFGDRLPAFLYAEMYFMQFCLTVFILAMGVIVFKRYQIAQNYQMAEATRMSKALQHSEERLRELLQKQQTINNIKLIQSERERLLMEIHDGVGSQLISGMLLAKKQDLSRETLLDMFQVCMDDVRVIIDCISLGKPANAAKMIGAMLERQRQRLLGLGIILEFSPATKGNARNHDISDAQCLHASRIVQECIANAIKHAQCNKITVQLRQYREHLLIVIRDNGEGLAPVDRMEMGRGLKNMRKRARLLAGQIRFLSRHDGFVVMLRFKNTAAEDWKKAA